LGLISGLNPGNPKLQIPKLLDPMFRVNPNAWTKFLVSNSLSKMIEFGMVNLTGREKTDMTDIDETVS
jgi:hypothetical protein